MKRKFYIGCLIFSFVSIGAWLKNYRAPQLFGRAIYYVKTTEKVVALTYDDGPTPPFTNQILEILKKYKIPATFFVLGKNAKNHPELIKEIFSAGHELGNHSWSHNLMAFKRPSFIKKEISNTDALLKRLGYNKEILFRAPYGAKLVTLPIILSKLNKKHILFDVIPADWRQRGATTIAKRVVRQTKPGSIILLHDGGDNLRQQTVQATEIIIQKLKDQGYSFLTVSNLLKKHRKT